ncbi:Uncharacterized protein HZ326_7122, partial [Fusarium oxysporum f. sp. albedinis]
MSVPSSSQQTLEPLGARAVWREGPGTQHRFVDGSLGAMSAMTQQRRRNLLVVIAKEHE